MPRTTRPEGRRGFFGRVRIPKELQPCFDAHRLQTNIGRMYYFSLYIILLQISLNILNILKPGDSKGGDVRIYVLLSMGTLLAGVLYFLLFRLVRRGRIRSPRTQSFLVYSLLYLYLLIQMTFCTLNILSTGGVNSYIIAILIVGMVPILPPLQSVLSILGSFFYLLIAMYASRFVSDTWGSILITDVWANLVIITGLTIFCSLLMYEMYVSNFLQSMKLAGTNADLEATVRERTQRLKEKTKAAEVASRAKSEFLARMSHEIRTPLNAIIGMTHIAQHADDPEKVRHSLGEIDTASVHLLEILNDILDMSKIESGKFEMIHDPFDLVEALGEVETLIRMRAEDKEIRLTTDIAALPPIRVVGDKLRLKQVLINLLGNAVKFTPEGGHIDLEVSLLREEAEAFTLSFSVRDDGIGMSGEQIKRLFVAFEQADPTIASRFGGTGLGLTISQNLVGQMGGRIEVTSAPGEGSRFFFTLGLPRAPGAPEDTQHPLDQAPDLSGKHILIVEDIEINRVILKELLSDTHAVFSEAVDGEDALRTFREAPEDAFDLIFMDIQMPGMDGYEVTRRLRALSRPDVARVPIIAMTANAYREDIERALESGMNGHTAKPLDLGAVYQLLARFLLPARGRRGVGETASGGQRANWPFGIPS